MKFEEAMENLRDSKLLTRDVWHGKRLEFTNDQLKVTTRKIPAESLKEKWNPDPEDILAQDWKVIDPDDIEEFSLSINELKNLGVSQDSIDELRKKNTMPLFGHLSDLVIDKEKLQNFSLSQGVIPVDILANIKTPEFTFTKKN